MKKLLLICFIALGLKASAQDEPLKQYQTKDGKVVYEKIEELNGKTKDQIYKNAKKWFVDSFKSSKDVLQTEDKDGGQLIGKGILVVESKGMMGITSKYDFSCSIQIDCKDGKYRCRIYNISHTLQGKTESDANAKYLVNVPAEYDNTIITGEAKGYSKGQKKAIVNLITGAEDKINALFDSLSKAVKADADNF